MNILPLAESKALYEAGIKIETRHGYVENGDEGKLFNLYNITDYNFPFIPAPTLDELLEKLKETAIAYNDELLISFSEFSGWFVRLSESDFSGNDKKLIIACTKYLLLKLKEKGYEV